MPETKSPLRGLLIGIAGGTGSGKTSVAQRILEGLGTEHVVIIEQDAYYHDLSGIPADVLHHHNFDHPDAFDMDLLLEHMQTLLAGGAVQLPIYDYTRHCRTGQFRTVGPHRVVVLEGILILFEPRLRDLMDIKIYVDTADDVRLMRRLRRDVRERGRTMEMVLDQYQATVRPMHQQFVEPSKRWADIIIPEGAEKVVAIDLIRTKIRQLLREK
ncbi:MAG: uridine kinase [Candidatus Zixiibacteriota bacterium]|nr:MAG: uridine kinase [candidate division Zixibacteria bacterium]